MVGKRSPGSNVRRRALKQFKDAQLQRIGSDILDNPHAMRVGQPYRYRDRPGVIVAFCQRRGSVQVEWTDDNGKKHYDWTR
jgi:hypothetical protein